jgi:hypothetical protein
MGAGSSVSKDFDDVSDLSQDFIMLSDEKQKRNRQGIHFVSNIDDIEDLSQTVVIISSQDSTVSSDEKQSGCSIRLVEKKDDIEDPSQTVIPSQDSTISSARFETVSQRENKNQRFKLKTKTRYRSKRLPGFGVPQHQIPVPNVGQNKPVHKLCISQLKDEKVRDIYVECRRLLGCSVPFYDSLNVYVRKKCCERNYHILFSVACHAAKMANIKVLSILLEILERSSINQWKYDLSFIAMESDSEEKVNFIKFLKDNNLFREV